MTDSWLGQNQEDAVAAAYFGERLGRFLDCGAFGFRELSNTRRLAERGWGGVLVEADPLAFVGMLAEVDAVCKPAGRTDIYPVCAAVLPEPGASHFWCGGGVSTASEKHRDLWKDHVAYRELWVGAITPDELLATFPGPFAMLSLDIEGCNLSVLERLPLYDMGVELAVVEHEGHVERVGDLLAQFGLTDILATNAENIVAARPMVAA